ncbi:MULTISPECIES: ead/Ea22-like family protein [Pseudomonas putida group]|uniref:Ead/Ea22-like family protein n=1 Tax=Pseudomonas putida TaxID=303 RepID=A0ABD7BI44_PSEPU|nr:ead/Ea22-like family protein [Pseudomonas putida]QOD00351.1 ead/Ea22-like family protein [Pseudomonas putida]
MTIDKQKLKALAEAATPGRHYDRLESAGGGIKYECAGDDGSLVLKVDHKNNEFGFVGDRGEADEAFFLACSPAAVLALLAEIERHEAWRTAFLAERDAQMRQRDQLRAENDGLRKALLEASEEVATWGAYASEYFQEKHDLAGCVAKIHAAAMAKEASHG